MRFASGWASKPKPIRHPAMQKTFPPRSHPLAVIHFRDLMNHFGIWVICLVVLQVWAAWRMGVYLDEMLQGGKEVYFALGVLAVLAIDCCIWFRRRGNLCNVFHLPGVILFLLALLPVFLLHLRDVFQNLK